jgi:hypothetical protein
MKKDDGENDSEMNQKEIKSRRLNPEGNACCSTQLQPAFMPVTDAHSHQTQRYQFIKSGNGLYRRVAAAAQAAVWPQGTTVAASRRPRSGRFDQSDIVTSRMPHPSILNPFPRLNR